MLRHRVNHYTDEFDQSCPRIAVAVAVAVYCAIGSGRDDSQNVALFSPSDDRQLIQRCARSLRLKLSAIAIK
jgi:hypothetical protein